MGSRSPTTDDEATLLTAKEAAAILKVSVDALRYWRRLERGPAFLKLGHRTVRYRRSDLERWLKEQEVSHAS